MHKILIIPKKGEDNLYNLLPLIKGLEIYFSAMEEEFKIHLLHSQNLSHQAALIKGRVTFHAFDEKEIGPLGSLKVAQKQDDLFNLTHSFCYRDDVGMVTLNKYLKAKNRYGYESLQGKLVNTHSLPPVEGISDKLFYFEPVSKFLKVTLEDAQLALKEELKNYSEPVENFFQANEIDPFIFMAFDKVEEESEAHLLLQSMANTFDQRIYLWVEEMNETAHKLFNENDMLLDISEADPINFDAYLEKCLGTITNLGWVCEMSSYFGVDAMHFDCESFLKTDYPNPNITLIKTKGPGLFDLYIVDGAETIIDSNIDALNDHTHQFFSL